jgi:hypothetical protein
MRQQAATRRVMWSPSGSYWSMVSSVMRVEENPVASVDLVVYLAR